MQWAPPHDTNYVRWPSTDPLEGCADRTSAMRGVSVLCGGRFIQQCHHTAVQAGSRMSQPMRDIPGYYW
eukprot:scaffold68964_cov78-Cyclotella_meneghiniana.AAC.8